VNVLYDYQIFQVQKYGGISRYFYEIISRVARMPDVNASLFQGFHINNYRFEKERSHFRSFFGVRGPRIPKTGKVLSAVNKSLFRRFAARNAPDVYHTTYYEDPVRALRAKRVVTVHDMIHEIFPADFPRDRTAEHKRIAVERADQIIAVSESTKRDLIRLLRTPPEKIRVIYHGNSLRSPGGEDVPVTGPYVLFVGLRSIYKNFDRLIQAFARSERLKKDFQLICFGGPPFRSQDLQRIEELRLHGRVLQLFGSDATLATLYKHALFLVYPSLYEGFGLPILEAMYYGCPVLCSNTSSLPEVAGDAARLFNPEVVECITDAMEDIAYNSEKRLALAERGPKQETKFSWDRCAQETAATYKN
jgi:glycosyltransferase involved in cell wall biosynthesis